MALRLDPEHPTRVYYGTDTHATGLMVGAALALALAAPHRAWTRTALWERHRRTVAAAALAVLGALLVLADERSALTFRGGILLASLATAALVLTVVERPGRLRAAPRAPGRPLGRRPQLRPLPVALAGRARRGPGPPGRARGPRLRPHPCLGAAS